jgi:hypothetical protein
MRHTHYIILLIALFVSACNGDAGKKQPENTSKDSVLSRNWYKRFTGMIGGQLVVVNMQCNEGEISGAYCYNKEEKVLELYENVEETTAGKRIFFEVNPTDKSDSNDFQNNPRWEVIFAGDSVTGKWISRDKTKTYAIALKEDYSGDAYQLDVISFRDSVMVRHDSDSAGAKTTDQLVIPSDKLDTGKANFLRGVVQEAFNCGGKEITMCIKEKNANYFDVYKAEMDSGDVYNYEEITKVNVRYNSKGWVVLGFFSYAYMGGAHGIYGTSYRCLDMQNKKTWAFDEVLQPDTAKIVSLLEQEARRMFGIPEEEPLMDRLVVDKIPFTDNIYFTPAGITFCYGTYELGSFADGEVLLFLPYAQLSGLLQPAFRQRMNL